MSEPTSIDVPVAESGTPILATWGNQVRQDLLELDAGKLSLTGGTMTGQLSMGTHTIVGLGDATGAGMAVSRGYGDARYAVLAAAGNQFAGNISSAGGWIGVGDDPTNAAANPGARFTPGSAIQSSVGTVGSPNIFLRRAGGGIDPGQPFIRFTRGAANDVIGSITIATTTSVNYGETSDYRLKNDLGPITDAVERVRQLQPKRITWIAEPESGEQDGFLAHEVTLVVPEAVAGDKDAVAGPPPLIGQEVLDEQGNLTGETEMVPDPSAPPEGTIEPQQLDTSRLVPLLTAALQAALDQIDTLTARVTALEAS